MEESKAHRNFDADPEAVADFMGRFFGALVDSGVAEICISPGSRSTPLAVGALRTTGLRIRSIVDERSAGFFALGLARQSQAPVALICTSGTAAANYLPAVVEAHHARIPLLVLTADRPPELRDWGAGQTIDQVGIYGTAVRRFVDVPPPVSGPHALRYAGSLASRAVADSVSGPAGPVHLNFPLREPLEPPRLNSPTEKERDTTGPIRVRVSPSVRAPDPGHLRALVSQTGECPRGLISCGPRAPDVAAEAAIARLSSRTGWPILADPTSQMRRGAHSGEAVVLAHSDLWLRDPEVASALAPDVVVRFGDSPVSKSLRRALARRPPDHFVLVDPDGVFHDPDHLASEVIRADPRSLCDRWLEQLGEAEQGEAAAAYSRTCRRVDTAVARALSESLETDAELLEPHVARVLTEVLPAEATLMVSNSMPIRDLDAFLPQSARPLRVLSQRGASGIDGLVSGAAGASAADLGPVVLFTGDLALLHDVGGLLTARDHALSLTLVIIENNGGGIFSFLPVAEQADEVDFERLFRTPHNLNLAHAAELYGATFQRVRDASSLSAAVRARVGAPGVHMIEVPVEPESNLKCFRQAAALASSTARENLN